MSAAQVLTDLQDMAENYLSLTQSSLLYVKIYNSVLFSSVLVLQGSS